NGVVVVTTKTGKRGKALGINISSSVTFSRPYIFPDYQNSYGQGPDPNYFEFVNGLGAHGGYDESWGPKLNNGYEFVQYTSLIADSNNPQPLPWVSRSKSVINDFYQTGLMTDSNVSLSGGSETASYRLSLAMTD